MTLREHELRHSRRAQRQSQKQKRRKRKLTDRRMERRQLALTLGNQDDRVLTFIEWCALNGFSPRTGRRILASGDGPVVVQLAPHRMGIRVGDNRRWQESRARGGEAA